MHESGGWLAATVPAAARRFRVSDPDIAHSLREAGATFVEHNADVEIGSLHEISGDAPCAIVGLNLNVRDSYGRLSQVSRRIAMSGAVRVRAAAARATLRRLGYSHVEAFPWDRDQLIQLPGITTPRPRNTAERFLRRVVLVASRERPERTAFEHALNEARKHADIERGVALPIVGSGSLIVLLEDSVLRVAVGPASHQIDIQAKAFEALHAQGSSDIISTRVPRLLARGNVGLAQWSLERRLPGRQAHPRLHRSLFNQCFEFLVALYGVRTGSAHAAPAVVTKPSEILAAYAPLQAAAVADLCDRIEDEVGHLQIGFGHGDFWPSNLLVRDEQLLAVIDWERAGSRRLPLQDLFHLHLLAVSQAGTHEWGLAFLTHLLPLARRGGNAMTRDYLERVGVDVSHRQLEYLVAAYWLDFVCHQLGTFFDRRRDPRWIEQNVTQVLTPLLQWLSRPHQALSAT